MLNGRYDESSPLESETLPLFRLLRDPKRLELYEGGHSPTKEVYVPATQKWLDEMLGPVAQ